MRDRLRVSDEEAATYTKKLLLNDPRRLHVLAARNPLATTRCFHYTVRMVISCLFNCADKPGAFPDNIAANDLPGIFGYVRAYMGVVEPQMRKALHMHMLVQLVGFSHPGEIFCKKVLPDMFKRVWRFVASVCFRSTVGLRAEVEPGSLRVP